MGVRLAIVGALAAAAGMVTALASGGSAPTARPLPGLPAYTAGFESWLRLNRRPIPPRAADPHDGTKNIYVNQSRSRIAPGGRQRYPYPYGTVVVKRSIRRDRTIIAVMRKVRGANRAHNDWVMVEFVQRRGGPRFEKVASGSICTGCHIQAKRRDYVFTRLQPSTG